MYDKRLVSRLEVEESLVILLLLVITIILTTAIISDGSQEWCRQRFRGDRILSRRQEVPLISPLPSGKMERVSQDTPRPADKPGNGETHTDSRPRYIQGGLPFSCQETDPRSEQGDEPGRK